MARLPEHVSGVTLTRTDEYPLKFEKPTPVRTYRRRMPLHARQAHPSAWAAALQLAKGDTHRLGIEEDGSVIIYNSPTKKRVGRD